MKISQTDQLWPEQNLTLPILVLRFNLVAEDELYLPPLEGDLIRSAIGLQLRRLCCTLRPPQVSCHLCVLSGGCAYSVLFDTPVQKTDTFVATRDVPRPFAVDPPISGPETYKPGEPVSFDIRLFGRAIEYAGYFIRAVEQASQHGIGQGRARCRLLDVTDVAQEAVIYANGQFNPGAIRSRSLSALVSESLCACTLRVILLTPLRLKSGGYLSVELPIYSLARAALIRHNALVSHHWNGQRLEPRPYLEAAAGVKVLAADLHWCERSRWSSRQQRRLPLGGLLGSVTYGGVNKHLLELMRIGEVLHIGKASTSGYGMIKLVASQTNSA